MKAFMLGIANMGKTMRLTRNDWAGKTVLAVRKAVMSVVSGLLQRLHGAVSREGAPARPRVPDAHKRIQEELNAAVWSQAPELLKEVAERASAMMGPAAFRGAAVYDRAGNISWRGVPLHEAIGQCDLDCVNALIPLSDVKQQNAYGVNALMIAAQGGNIELFNRVFPLSDAHAVNKNGDTALMLIANQGFDERHEALLAARCDVNQANSSGDGALSLALAASNHALANALLPRANEITRKRAFRIALVNARTQGMTGLTSHDAQMEAWSFVDQLASCVSPADGEEAFEHCGRSAEKMPAWAAKLEARALREAIGAKAVEEAIAGRAEKQAQNTKRAARL